MSNDGVPTAGGEPPVVRNDLAGTARAQGAGRGARRWPLAALLVLAIGAVAFAALGGRNSTPGASAPTVTVTVTVGPDGRPPSGSNASGGTAGSAVQTPLDRVPRRDPAEAGTLGRTDAPVVLVIFSDYQCGYCAAWVNGTQPSIVDRYVRTGKVRLEWRDANIFGPPSIMASRAAFAAGRQGKFWTYHAALFAPATKPTPAQLTVDGLTALAGRLGLDTDRFRTDLQDPAITTLVERNETEAFELGVTSTPQFVIGHERLVGAQPVAAFEKAIDKALADAATNAAKS